MKSDSTLLRKRRILLVMPLLLLPFVTILFRLLTGPAVVPANTGNGNGQLNVQLPDPTFRDEKGINKMRFYDNAVRDSLRRAELERKDPFFRPGAFADSNRLVPGDTNEEKIYNRLAALDRELNRQSANPASRQTDFTAVTDDRYERFPPASRQTATDPELEKLERMLDKVMAIQQPPGTVTGPADKKVFAVSTPVTVPGSSLLVSEQTSRSDMDTIAPFQFYPVQIPTVHESRAAIQAVIHETRSVVNGSIIKLRLLSAVRVAGATIPPGTFVYGRVNLTGERLLVSVDAIRYLSSLYPVKLVVYDLDALSGVFIPGAITREVAKESSDRAIQGLALGSLNPTVGAQAASAGIEAAKTLLTRKIKLTRVTVKAGYRVLLLDEAGY